MAFKMKGFTPFTKKIDPVKKPVGPVTPSTRAEYMQREVWNVVQRNKDKKKKKKSDEDFDKKYNRANQKSPLKKATDPPREATIKVKKLAGGGPKRTKKEHVLPKITTVTATKKRSPLKKATDPPNGKKPKDDDSDRMTDAQNKAHEEKVEKYNKEKGNYEKMSKNPALVKKIVAAGQQIRVQIDKLNNKGSLSEDEKARLADLKRDYSSNQRLLHNIRGK